MLGRYTNKHNGRMIEIDRVEIGDTGASFWYAGAYDCFTTRELENHWELIGQMPVGTGSFIEEYHKIEDEVRKAVQVICDYCDARNEHGLISTLQGFLDHHFGVDEE